MSCAEQGVHHNVCLCVCVCPLLSSHRLWLSVMSERVTLGQIRDPVANKASRFTLPRMVKKSKTWHFDTTP